MAELTMRLVDLDSGVKIMIVAAFFVYFLPTIIGIRKRNASAILVLNLLLGWTFIGWVVALVWAMTHDK